MNILNWLSPQKGPVILAPLAGVSDHPFRRICTKHGADLTYVEMISATALLYESRRTYDMLKRHESEERLGVQITGKTADETAAAIKLLAEMNFETIDINMGCPVKKVVKTGCGSAILKDPARVFETVEKSRAVCSKPLSVKIRIGWDRANINTRTVTKAAEDAGADWITIHGRTREDDYSVPVNLNELRETKEQAAIPVIGNGNIFSRNDAHEMMSKSQVDGVMVSRGALGNPWVFADIKGRQEPVHIDEWFDTVSQHLAWQLEEYGDRGMSAICMRKHLLWYTKGWPSGKKARETINKTQTTAEAKEVLGKFYEEQRHSDHVFRHQVQLDGAGRFDWDPKYEMDRVHDRGGDYQYDQAANAPQP